MDNINEIIKNIKRRKNNDVSVESNNKTHKKLVLLLSKIMILSILFLVALIYSKSSESNKLYLYEKVFADNISFASINNFYNKYLGDILPFGDIFKSNKPVFNETLSYSDSSIYKDGVMLTVNNDYLVPVIEGGIVVFVGDKDGYGKTVVIQQPNGVNLWYGNILNLNVKIYDYVEKGSLLGEVKDNKLYLVYEKEGKFLDYKEYLK